MRIGVRRHITLSNRDIILILWVFEGADWIVCGWRKSDKLMNHPLVYKLDGLMGLLQTRYRFLGKCEYVSIRGMDFECWLNTFHGQDMFKGISVLKLLTRTSQLNIRTSWAGRDLIIYSSYVWLIIRFPGVTVAPTKWVTNLAPIQNIISL